MRGAGRWPCSPAAAAARARAAAEPAARATSPPVAAPAPEAAERPAGPAAAASRHGRQRHGRQQRRRRIGDRRRRRDAPALAARSPARAAQPARLPGVACSGTSPITTTGTAASHLVVDAGQKGQAWNRFYEKVVAADHANTVLTTAYGRNIQAALKKGHDQAGFGYVRFHGILDDDVGVYSEPGGVPTYTWTKLDQIYDAIIAAGMRPFVEISFMPKALASDADQGPDVALVQQSISQYQSAPRLDGLANVHAEPGSAPGDRVTAPPRFATTGTSRSGTSRRGCIRRATPATTSSTRTPCRVC